MRCSETVSKKIRYKPIDNKYILISDVNEKSN